MGKRILFIHHGSIAGGAPLSMLYTMQGMREAGYEPIAALVKPSIALHELYNTNGFKTVETPWIPIFITWSGSEGKRWNPIMWKGVYDAWRTWKRAHVKLADLLQEINVDIVHLNSVGLSNPATLLMRLNKPFVWHVREHGPSQRGRRYRFIRERLLKASQVIFLSAAEQLSWVGPKKHGTIVHNFVDFKQFDDGLSVLAAKSELGIPKDKKVILYVGGRKKHKGVVELLRALGEIKRRGYEDFVCLMPDSAIDTDNVTRIERKMQEIIVQYNLTKHCNLIPFSPDIVNMFSACDLLVFPATQPHFARPVVEASAMGKPVIASALPPMDELVVDGETGLLTPARDWKVLTEAILELLKNEQKAKEMGGNGRLYARENFGYEGQMKKIVAVYEQLEVR